jgi:hypothetical protein
VEGDDARFVIPLRRPMDLAATFRLRPAIPGTRVIVDIGGLVVLDQMLAEGWQDHSVALQRQWLVGGMNHAQVRQQVPRTGPGRHRVGGTDVVLPLEMVATSAGKRAGSHARFRIGREEIAVRGRGLAAVTVDPKSGEYAWLGRFDTFGVVGDADEFARRVTALPVGTVVAVAAMDDAATRWTARADHALRLLGAAGGLLRHERWSYALIGAVGASPGQAAEALDPRREVSVAVGRAAGAQVYGVAWARLELRADAVRFR